MNRNHKTGMLLAFGLMILLAEIGPVLGQPGNPRSTTPRPTPTPTPKRIIPPPIKKPPPERISPTSRQPSCTAQSPAQSTGRVRSVNLGHGVTMEMVEIPAGSFCMGSDNVRPDEKPFHQVTINYSFDMGKYEVTQAQWQAVMGNNPSYFKACGGNCPVEYVSWVEAENFISRLNERNDGFRYRLPTEAEWEYACRAGTTGDYAGTLSKMAWYSENSGSKTQAVGGKDPNAWGLADMHGNVSEWCQDWYYEPYYGAPADGSAWLRVGEEKYRVVRGGSYDNLATFVRSANRLRDALDNRYSNRGFRVVGTSSAKSTGDAASQLKKFDEFGYMNYEEYSARLDSIATTLRNEPTSQGYFLFYKGGKSLPGATLRYMKGIQNYLINNKGIDPSRMILLEGGQRDEMKVEFWISPVGSPAPIPNPAVSAELTKTKSYLYDNYSYDCDPLFRPKAKAPDFIDDCGFADPGFEGQSARLDGFVKAVSQTPGATAHLRVYFLPRDARPQVQKFIQQEKDYLVSKGGLNVSSIAVVAGRERKNRSVELWLVPPGVSQ